MPEPWRDAFLAGSVASAAGPGVTSAAVVVTGPRNGDTPRTLGADAALWRGTPDDPEVQRLAGELTALQVRAQLRVAQALSGLLTDEDLRAATRQRQRPAQVAGRLAQPDGSPAAGLRVTLDDARLTAAEAETAAASTAADGTFVIPLQMSAG